jgi:hypothetical protein
MDYPTEDIERLVSSLTTTPSNGEIRRQLSVAINEMILSDFDKLVMLLYRLDINETKLRKILNENPSQDAGNMIADLIIERQLQKIKSRQQFSQRDNNISEEEKW